MTSIKKQIRKNEKPLQQLVKRYKEIQRVSSSLLKSNLNKKKIIFM